MKMDLGISKGKEFILEVLHGIVNNPKFLIAEYRKSIQYNYNNLISQYLLSNDNYRITKRAKLLLESKNKDLTSPIKKGDLKYIRENKKKIFLYEHLVPNSVKENLIMKVIKEKGGISKEELKEILELGDIIIATKSEDKILDKKYRSSLPEECDPRVNPELRYELSGIELSETIVKMIGDNSR